MQIPSLRPITLYCTMWGRKPIFCNTYKWKISFRNCESWEFPGGLMVRTRHVPCCGPGSIPGLGTEIPTHIRLLHTLAKKSKYCFLFPNKDSRGQVCRCPEVHLGSLSTPLLISEEDGGADESMGMGEIMKQWFSSLWEWVGRRQDFAEVINVFSLELYK